MNSSSSMPLSNASDSSSEPARDIIGGLIPQHNIMGTYVDATRSSSPSSMQNVAMNNMIDSLPIFDHGLSVSTSNASCYGTQACMTQVEANGNDFYGCHELFGGNIEVEGEIFIPPLESIPIEEPIKSEIFSDTNPNNNLVYNNMNNIVNSYFNINKVENTVGLANYWEAEGIKVGEWDFEELMKEVHSLPSFYFE